MLCYVYTRAAQYELITPRQRSSHSLQVMLQLVDLSNAICSVVFSDPSTSKIFLAALSIYRPFSFSAQ